MNKDASIGFGMFFISFVVFSLLSAFAINDMMSSLSSIENFFEILQNIGITGYFYLTMSAASILIALVFLFKAFRN